MKFTLECDEMDGLVFIDKSHLAELNSDILYSMDILLDPFGETELTFDFPNEDWKTVWNRETKASAGTVRTRKNDTVAVQRRGKRVRTGRKR